MPIEPETRRTIDNLISDLCALRAEPERVQYTMQKEINEWRLKYHRVRKIRFAAEEVCRLVDSTGLAEGNPILKAKLRTWAEEKLKRFPEDYQDAMNKTLDQTLEDGMDQKNMPEAAAEFKSLEKIMDIMKGYKMPFLQSEAEDLYREIRDYLVQRMPELPEAQNELTLNEIAEFARKNTIEEYIHPNVIHAGPEQPYNRLRCLPPPEAMHGAEVTPPSGPGEYELEPPCDGLRGAEYLQNLETGRLDNEVDGR